MTFIAKIVLIRFIVKVREKVMQNSQLNVVLNANIKLDLENVINVVISIVTLVTGKRIAKAH